MPNRFFISATIPLKYNVWKSFISEYYVWVLEPKFSELVYRVFIRVPLVKLNPDREASRFDFLKGRLLTSSDPPDFGNARLLFEKSIQADEASGAVVQAAQTKYYLAQMLVLKGEIERSRYILDEITDIFGNWGIPFWQKKCRFLITQSSVCRDCEFVQKT